jgi:hypothetical protein
VTEIDSAKLAKLPQWAQTCIRELQSEVAHYAQDLDDARARVEALPEGTADTMLVADDPAGVLPSRPLGDGATIEFGGILEARYGVQADIFKGLRGRKVLLITAWDGMSVVPVDADRVAIVTAEGEKP